MNRNFNDFNKILIGVDRILIDSNRIPTGFRWILIGFSSILIGVNRILVDLDRIPIGDNTILIGS